ncbi:MAG: WG repeat-containing protein [Myxococcota bacterium]
MSLLKHLPIPLVLSVSCLPWRPSPEAPEAAPSPVYRWVYVQGGPDGHSIFSEHGDELLSGVGYWGDRVDGYRVFQDTASGRWGYLNAKFQIAIPPQFDSADDFSHAHAVVRQHGRCTLINTEGKPIGGYHDYCQILDENMFYFEDLQATSTRPHATLQTRGAIKHIPSSEARARYCGAGHFLLQTRNGFEVYDTATNRSRYTFQAYEGDAGCQEGVVWHSTREESGRVKTFLRLDGSQPIQTSPLAELCWMQDREGNNRLFTVHGELYCEASYDGASLTFRDARSGEAVSWLLKTGGDTPANIQTGEPQAPFTSRTNDTTLICGRDNKLGQHGCIDTSGRVQIAFKYSGISTLNEAFLSIYTTTLDSPTPVVGLFNTSTREVTLQPSCSSILDGGQGRTICLRLDGGCSYIDPQTFEVRADKYALCGMYTAGLTEVVLEDGRFSVLGLDGEPVSQRGIRADTVLIIDAPSRLEP